MKQCKLFNLFYINYEKAYEIATLIDNKIPYRSADEKGRQTSGYGEIVCTDDEDDEIRVRVAGLNEKAVTDEYSFEFSKSTVMQRINENAKEIDAQNRLIDTNSGCIVLINNCSLKLVNKPETMSIKSLTNFTLKVMQTNYDDNRNNQTPFEGIVSEYAYIFEADSKYVYLPIIFKIPMTTDNEFLSGYNVDDLEFGMFTIVGIYKGIYVKKVLYEKIGFSNGKKVSPSNARGYRDAEKVHYIDLIGVMEYLGC